MKAYALLFALSPVCFACPGGPVKSTGVVAPKQAQKSQTQPAESAPQQQATTLPENPKALLLRPFFYQSLRRPAESKVDPFRSNLARFAPHVEVALEEEQEKEEEPKTPLEYYDVDSYKLVLIMSGTAQPKALVVDPKGKSYILSPGTRIGTRQGKVVSITSTEVRIEEPGRPPVIKALEPPVTEMEKELQAVQEF